MFFIYCPGATDCQAKLAFVLGLKPLGTRGLGLKYMYDPTDKNNSLYLFCSRVPWLYQYWPGGFMLFVVLYPGTHEGSTGIVSGFKASQKKGQWLKVSSDRLGKPGTEPATPGLQDIGLSPTHFCGFPGYKPVPPGWFNVRNTQRLTESGFMEKPGNVPANPGLQGIALHHGGFSQFTIPRRLH